MRILQICSARSIGGGEKHVASLANRLSRQGHNVFVAIAPNAPLLSFLQDIPRENIIELPMRNALSLGSAWKLARFARTHQVQIIHAHLGRDYPLAALAAGRASARLVLTRHVMFPLGRVHKLTLRRTARVIGVSRAVADALKSQAIFKPEIIRVIHNGIDAERFARAKAAAPTRHNLRIGTVGEFAPVKRHDDLIKAAQMICANRDDVEFVITGDDETANTQHRKYLERLVVDLHLEDHVRLMGWVDDIAALVATFDLFVSTSESESFGMAMAESMAAGVPVIATATAGASEIIQPDVNGRLVPIGDIDAIAHAISELLANESERRRLSRNGETVAREQFGLERMVDETEQLYQDMIDESTIAVPAP